MGDKKLCGKKCHFGHFGAFWGFFEPLGTQSEFFKNLKILFLQYNETKYYYSSIMIPSCKISENSHEWFLLKAPDERADERTDERE